MFGVVAILVGAALVLHFATWQRRGLVNWPALVNMLGLLVLAATGVLDPPPGRLRLLLSALALGLIFPSAVLLLMRTSP
ncbi:MAG: hypothetical protein DMD78_28625 [Candidatus Rokuibacteriota bacterium]|nr:MAG: hypothetical protein DMD78_28625 [Candidatus Rokubacteria bacterium]